MEHESEEVWKPIPGYEGLYSVSDQGRVRRDAGGSGARSGKVLKPRPRNRGGHYAVTLCSGGRVEHLYVHCLVMLAFVGFCPPGMEVCHTDGNPSNNYLSNLRYDTRRENRLDAHRQGRKAVPTQILNLEQVAEIRRLLDAGLRHAVIARKFGVHKSTIGHIKTGYSWDHRLDQTLAA